MFAEITESIQKFVDILKKKNDNEKVIIYLTATITSLVVMMLAGNTKMQQEMLTKILDIQDRK